MFCGDRGHSSLFFSLPPSSRWIGLDFFESTAWCSEIGSLVSHEASEFNASSDVREPISLHKAVFSTAHFGFHFKKVFSFRRREIIIVIGFFFLPRTYAVLLSLGCLEFCFLVLFFTSFYWLYFSLVCSIIFFFFASEALSLSLSSKFYHSFRHKSFDQLWDKVGVFFFFFFFFLLKSRLQSHFVVVNCGVYWWWD